jgi:ADP-heptose:LPS heptosyltransferase
LKTAGVVDLQQELISCSHNGALIQQMDLVMGVCTSVMHLAGPLNIPSIVLLSTHADWHWLVDEKQSTWYPNTSILRQAKQAFFSFIVDYSMTSAVR